MARSAALACLALLLCAPAAPGSAHSWFSDYSTGSPEFRECCGYRDCHTAESLGFPEIRRRGDGGYSVFLGKHWIDYDHPAVHTSHDSNTWICYLGEAADNPDPLCIFFPAGMM